MNILAWNAPPPTAELARAIAAHEKPLYLAVCLPDLSLPEFRPSESPSALEQALQQAINAQSGCIQFNGVNALNDILPDAHLWLLPPANASRLHEHFPQPVRWQTEPVAQVEAQPQKPWFTPPTSRTAPERALVIGAGIAGAATARALADSRALRDDIARPSASRSVSHATISTGRFRSATSRCTTCNCCQSFWPK